MVPIKKHREGEYSIQVTEVINFERIRKALIAKEGNAA
jgi:hypothetical protein